MSETRSKVQEEHLKKIDRELGELSAAYRTVINKVDSSDLTLKALGNRQEKIENIVTDINQKYETDDNGNQAKLPKIDFPYFNGEGPREWVRKARKYFQLHQVADELKVGIAEMYLKGKADIWFHGFAASHPNAEWNVFTSELCRRFSETTGEEVVEAFSKIRQFGSITEYQEKFEELKTQVMLSLPHLPETYYISIFTSGLKGEIKSMVKMLKPTYLTQAFEIATLQENTISAINRT
ncbi:Uncharacterized protein Adt_28553 [Abeliophyllum distichum]|uniref:Retrotransposon gag domain-containing protein n=1 Tax=Abeliophyllum distichum TaxID=126358 RepID=A0ABD1RWV7_9LAMI